MRSAIIRFRGPQATEQSVQRVMTGDKASDEIVVILNILIVK
jgi:hypothetical protein